MKNKAWRTKAQLIHSFFRHSTSTLHTHTRVSMSQQPHIEEDPQLQLREEDQEDHADNFTADDIEEVVPDHDEEGDVPMDDDDDDNDEDAEPQGDGTLEGEQSQGQQEEFVDNSIAAFYSHRKSLFCVALHPQFPNPPLALTGGEDDGGWIWNTQDGSEVVRLGGHTDSVTAAQFSADGELAATGGMDGKIRVWRKHGADWRTWEFLTSLEGPDEVVWMDWHPKGPVLSAGGADSTVWMWQRE